MRLRSLGGEIVLLCFSIATIHQSTTHTPQDPQLGVEIPQLIQPEVPAKPAARLVVKEGTEVKLKFSQALNSKTAIEGDPVSLALAEDLKVGEKMIAPAGTKALGTVAHAKKAGMMGKAGELNIRLEYLLVGDSRMRLRGSKGREGQGKEGTVVALTVIFGPIGLIKHGKNVKVQEGSSLVAYVDQDFVVATQQ